jgi:hypothetical protein
VNSAGFEIELTSCEADFKFLSKMFILSLMGYSIARKAAGRLGSEKIQRFL